MSMIAPPVMEDLPATQQETQQCPLGYQVLIGRVVDPLDGCGYNKCYPLSCNHLKTHGL